jgi:DNA-binding response OmpR family regulator
VQAVKKRVLFVSEDGGACERLTALLARRGHQVVTAPSLVTALLVSRGQAFNLYVIDAQFWGGEGTELCRTIRVFDPWSSVILFSSTSAESARLEAFAAGATSYILKPDVERLIEAVSHVTYDVLPDRSESGRGVR